MNRPMDDDDALMAEVGAAIRENVGPVPDELVAAAEEIFTWRTIDGELAALTFDSLLDEPAGAVRSPADVPRVLTFEAGGLTVELEVESPASGRRLSGQLVPPEIADVRATAGADVQRVSADQFGKFVLPLPARPGPVDVRVTRSSGRPVALLAFL